MKVLIADDVQDLVEVLSLMIQGIFPDCEVLQAFDGAQAIALIEKNPDLSIVFSDYNMPKRNGGHVFQFLRKNHPDTPFVLISTAQVKDHKEFNGAEKIAVIGKPFTDAELEKVVRSFQITTGSQTRTYVPVLIEVLRKINLLEAPIFLKLSGDNFIKVLHPGSTFTDVEYERFQKKAIKKLWIEYSSYDSFILNYKKEILSREIWKELANAEAAHTLAIDHQVIMDAGKSFGWSPATVQMASENIRQVSKLLERNPDFREVAKRLASERQSRLSTLSVLLAVACTGILEELGWTSEVFRQKITFACLLHDMDLDEDLLSTMMTVLSEGDMKDFSQDPSLQRIFEHPMKTADAILKWNFCPPEVDVIIRQHHERPDGSGFPLGLTADQIHPLAALLILAEDMIFHSVHNMGGDPEQYLREKQPFYSQGEFAVIYNATLRSITRRPATSS